MVQILRKLKHENIIAMLDSFESPQEFCVVTEFAQVIGLLSLFSLFQMLGHNAICISSMSTCISHIKFLSRSSRAASLTNKTSHIQGELFEILEDDKCLPEEQVQAIAKQLVNFDFFFI